MIIEFPNNATNGDMIKTLFPKSCIRIWWTEGKVTVDTGDSIQLFSKNWWEMSYISNSKEQAEETRR